MNYELKETDSFVIMEFLRVNQYRVRGMEVERGGRFFTVDSPAWDEPPKISLS